MRFAVYAISKNEIKHVKRFIDSCSGADSIVVLDTGSDDGTVEELRRLGADVYEADINPWRFDTARNLALAKVPENIDYCISLDIDERLVDGWRQYLESAIVPGNTHVLNWFIESHTSSKYWKFRIHARNGWGWRYRVHEELYNHSSGSYAISEATIVHEPDLTKSRSGYLPLIEQVLSDFPHNPRFLSYKAFELVALGEKDEAVDVLKLAIENAGSVIDSYEKSYYCITIANLLGADGYEWLLRAIVYAPEWRDAWYQIGLHYYLGGRFADAHEALERAIRLQSQQRNFQSVGARSSELYSMAAKAAYKNGQTSRAKSIMSIGMKIFGDDAKFAKLYSKLLLK